MNPYVAPQGYAAAPPAYGYDNNADYAGAVSTMLEAMRRTRPWVTMFAILSFVGGGFLVLGGIGMMFAGAAGGPAAMMGPGIGLLYLLIAGFYFVVGKLLWNYRSGIEGFLASGGSAGMLAAAIDRQASFWKFVGILSLVMMVLYFVVIVIAIGAGISAGMR